MNPVNDQLELNEVEQLKVQLRELKRELEITRMERDILKNGGDILEGSATMKYQAIEKMRETYPLEQLCTALGVSKSGYYAWHRREPSQRDQADARLREKIVLLWQKFRRVYGAP